MEPGLQIGDFVLVNKFAYGLKFPGTHVLLSELKGPARNDVAVFLPPHSLCDVKPEEARPDIISLSIKESQSFLNRFLSLQKNMRFLQLSDGSCANTLQIVMEENMEGMEGIKTCGGQDACIRVIGTLVAGRNEKNPVEIKAESELELESLISPALKWH